MIRPKSMKPGSRKHAKFIERARRSKKYSTWAIISERKAYWRAVLGEGRKAKKAFIERMKRDGN